MVETVLDEEGLLRFLRLRVRYEWNPSIWYILLFLQRRLLER